MEPIAGVLADRFGYNALMLIGLALMLGGCILMVGLNEESTAHAIALRVALVGIGMGTFQLANKQPHLYRRLR